MKTSVALYLRVSTDEQDVSMQRDELIEFCRKRGWTIVATYQDIGVSGKRDSRPELDRLLSDARKRKFDIVAVWKFDRFARSISMLLRSLELFQSLGIDFVSHTEAVDTTTAYGKLVFTILGAVAELERCLIAERVKAGMKAAKAKGQKFGRARAEVDAAVITGLRAQGISFASIAKQCGISVGTAFKLAKPEQQQV